VTADAGVSEQHAPAAAPRRVAVLDTNVWLDIHFFRDTASQSLAAALESQHWRAARCEQTDAELAIVLQRPPFSSDPTERVRLLECLRRWQQRTLLVAVCAPAPWRCRDPHDQKFLDLARAAGASVLLTKDKELLAVHRSARQDGLMILTPQQFTERFCEPGQNGASRLV
jgi:predicted nucleic acid-binding protein